MATPDAVREPRYELHVLLVRIVGSSVGMCDVEMVSLDGRDPHEEMECIQTYLTMFRRLPGLRIPMRYEVLEFIEREEQIRKRARQVMAELKAAGGDWELAWRDHPVAKEYRALLREVWGEREITRK